MPEPNKSATDLIRVWSGAFRRGLEAGLSITAQVDWREADEAGADLLARPVTWLEQSYGADTVFAFGISSEFAAALAGRGAGDVFEACSSVLDRASAALAAELRIAAWTRSPLHERAGLPDNAKLFAVSVTIDRTALPLLPVAIVVPSVTAGTAEQLGQLARATAPEGGRTVERPAPQSTKPSVAPASQSPNMALMLDMQLPVRISLGKSTLPLKDILKLTSGSVLELNRTIDDPVDIVVNDCVVAQGEVVVVEGNYGTRIQRVNDRGRLQASLPSGVSSR